WKYKVYYGERSEDNLVALARFEVEVDQDLYVLRSQQHRQECMQAQGREQPSPMKAPVALIRLGTQRRRRPDRFSYPSK
ncbi:MAG: hypothetical protein EBV92_01915, partial [Betaproteobacteria bacterium]|nr:hypothetical protein [Betaproteobacteria bacterium]